MQKRIMVVTVGLIASMNVGCSTHSGVFGGNMEDGMVLVLPGAEGQGHDNEKLADALTRGGVKSSVILRDWTGATRGLVVMNQRDERKHRRIADHIASLINTYQESFPNGKVQLIGHSAGAGVAIYVAEAMPDDRKIDAIYLLGPSLSSNYDLSNALERTRRSIVSFASKRDMVLYAGTSLVGTVDGAHEPAAGWGGFDCPQNQGDIVKTLYQNKLQQCFWGDGTIQVDINGSHYCWTSRKFCTSVLVPMIKAVESGQAPRLGTRDNRRRLVKQDQVAGKDV